MATPVVAKTYPHVPHCPPTNRRFTCFDPEAFLRHIVAINTPFKVWVVARLLQLMFDRPLSSLDANVKWIYASYTLIMWLGLIWYTAYWSPDGIACFFRARHPLTDFATANQILSAAALFHGVYAGLFYYEAESSALDKAIGVWQLSIAVMLLLTVCVNC